MTKTTTILCAAASSLALYAGSAGAAPLSTPLALKSAETQSTEAVRYYRRHHGRWIGAPRAYYGSGYNSYAYAPGYGAPPPPCYGAPPPPPGYPPPPPPPGYR